jgi:hypothetical protein
MIVIISRLQRPPHGLAGRSGNTMNYPHRNVTVRASMVGRLGSALVLWCALANSSLAADTPRQLLDPSLREAPAGRLLYVLLNDGGLTAKTYALGLSSVAGGILPSAIEGSVNGSRQKTAAVLLAPITAALHGVDLNEKVINASTEIATGVPWLNARIDPVADSKSDSRQRVALDYWIQMEPKFDALGMNLLVQIITPGKKKTEVIFRRYLSCFVPLQSPDSDANVNANRWASDDAALVRRALDLGLSRLSKMAVRGLQLTKSDLEPTKSLKFYRVGYSQKAVENNYGKIIEKDETGTMIETKFGDWAYYFWPTRETQGAL